MSRVGAPELFWQRIHHVERICRSKLLPLTVKHLLAARYNSEFPILEWTRKQLMLRIAYRLHDFHTLPFYVTSNPYIRSSYNWYYPLLDRFVKLSEVKTPESAAALIQAVQEVRATEDPTVGLLGQGLKQLFFAVPTISLDAFVERVFCFRIGQRLLMDHLLARTTSQLPSNCDGCIEADCRPIDVIQESATLCRNTCRGTYAIAPRVDIQSDADCVFSFVPDHLSLIVTEILKNAIRATVEFYTFHQSSVPPAQRLIVVDETDLPSVTVTVQKGLNELLIRVSDKGGGIPQAYLRSIFSFGVSSIETSQNNAPGGSLDAFVRSDMAGYGFGLPLARIFARYFGGDVQIMSCFGVGTDVFITLPHIPVSKEMSTKWDEHSAPCIQGDAVAHKQVLVYVKPALKCLAKLFRLRAVDSDKKN